MTDQLRSALDSDAVKIVLRLAAIIAIPWSVWITKSVVALNAFSQGARFTAIDAHNLEMRIDRRFDALPPADWRARIENIERDLRDLRTSQRAWIDEMSRDFLRKDETPN